MSDALPLIVGLKWLYAQGARFVVVNYTGEGDEGGIEAVRAYKSYNIAHSHGRLSEHLIPNALVKQIQTWADLLIDSTFDGEGCFGQITINLKTLGVRHDHSERYIETSDSRRKFVLGEPPKRLRRVKKKS